MSSPGLKNKPAEKVLLASLLYNGGHRASGRMGLAQGHPTLAHGGALGPVLTEITGSPPPHPNPLLQPPLSQPGPAHLSHGLTAPGHLPSSQISAWLTPETCSPLVSEVKTLEAQVLATHKSQ